MQNHSELYFYYMSTTHILTIPILNVSVLTIIKFSLKLKQFHFHWKYFSFVSDSFWMPRITQMSNSMRVGYPLPLSLIAESANYRSQWIIGVGELSESANYSISLNTQRAKPTANQIFAYSIQGSWKFKMNAHPLEVFFYRSPIKPHVTVYVIILKTFLKT